MTNDVVRVDHSRFPIPEVNDGANHVYVSVGHGQMMTDAMTPLGLSVWQMTTPAPMREAGGRLFVDVTMRLATPSGRAALLDVFGQSDPLLRDALQTVLDRDDFVPSLPDEAPSDQPIGNSPAPMETDPAIVTELIELSQASIARCRRDIQTTSGPELFEFIVADFQELRRILFDPRSHQAFMTAIDATFWLNEHVLTWLGEKNVADTLTQSVPHNVTSEMGLALLDVADVIRSRPEVVTFLHDVEDDGFLDELNALDGGHEVRVAIEAFLDTYGMRCVGEIDITRPRWSERPATLVPVLLGHVDNIEPGAAARRFEQGRDEASNKEAELLERLRSLPDGDQKAAETKLMIDRVRTFIGYREYPKYGMVSRYFIYKQALLKEADRLVEAGLLREREDIFFLRFQELHDVARTRRVDEQLIDERKDAFRSYESLTPPRVLTSDGQAVAGSYHRDDLPSGALVGLAVSGGTVEGRARVVRNIADADLEPGDILVTAYTDPSWTPLFVAIAGVVTEVGGMMTHGAVIAREYGLPAVVGVERATELIRDGQRIRLDGTEGYVVVVRADAVGHGVASSSALIIEATEHTQYVRCSHCEGAPMSCDWFRNGTVYTMDVRNPWATSVVVHDDVIVYVGNDEGARAHLRTGTDEHDLARGFLMPGFIDGHNHLIGGAMAKIGVSLEGMHGKDAVLEQIRRYSLDHPHTDVIRGHGWTPFTFGPGVQPHRTWLDQVTDVRPAFLHTYDVHDVWANTAAFLAAGIDATTPDPNPPTGVWPRDPDGFPAGTCCEPESWLPIAIALGMFSMASVKDAMALSMMPAPSWGITSYYDASTLLTSAKLVREAYQHLLELDAAGDLPVRIVGSHLVRDMDVTPERAVASLRALNEEVRSKNITVTTLKLFMDGVGPQHTASMLEPYTDVGHRGGWVLEPDFVRMQAEAANLAGFDVHIHACGDAGVRGALDAFEIVTTTHPELAPRNTVCHLEFCHPDDVQRFAALGVTANGTPIWGTDYRGEFIDAYPALVGDERFRRDYCPYGSVVRTGANVTFGADCPGVEVHEIAPLVQIESAVTRQRPGRADDRPAGAHERVTVAQALQCYTLNGARALRLEHETGSVEVGKQADLVVLAQSPFDVSVHEIHSIPVRQTMLGGRFTHRDG